MKFVVNTTYSAAGTVVLDELVTRLVADGHTVVRNNWEKYEGSDVALFVAPDSKVRQTKQKYPSLRCGIFDPKATRAWQRAEARAADFLVVSSVEQREFFLQFNKNIFIYYMFPPTVEAVKEHGKKEKVIIGYHGNKQHLDAMKDVSWALDKLAVSYNIELRAIYNIKKLGTWKRNVPKKCSVQHLQWTEQYTNNVQEFDIGISPSMTPVGLLGKALARPLRSYLYNPEGYINQDHVLRFKPSNNPGRIYVFSQLSIPVVADFTPSSCALIEDGVSGLLVGTKEGWMRALEMLIQNVSLRNTLSKNLKASIQSRYSPEATHEGFMSFLEEHYGSRQ